MVYNELINQLTDALERGDVSADEVERLLRRRRRDDRSAAVADVLRAGGVILCYTGAALLYAIGFGSYPTAVQAVTPFLFPAAALGAAVVLHRTHRPGWEVELAGMVGYVALAAAYLAAGLALDAGPGLGLVASIVATAVVVAVHAAVRIVRLTGWGLSASLVAFTGFAADMAGMLDGRTASWWLAVQCVAAVLLGAVLVRRSREGAGASWRTAALLAAVASVAGIANTGSGHLGPWHVLLTVAVAATLLAAATYDLPGLMWTGAVISVVWLGELAVLVGSNGGWAVGVTLFGLGLIGLASLLGRARRSATPPPGAIVGPS